MESQNAIYKIISGRPHAYQLKCSGKSLISTFHLNFNYLKIIMILNPDVYNMFKFVIQKTLIIYLPYHF